MDKYEFRQKVVDRYSSEELLEILDLSTEEIFDAFEDMISDDPDILEELGEIDVLED